MLSRAAEPFLEWRARARIERADAHTPADLRRAFGGCSDRLWGWLLVRGAERGEPFRRVVPEVPDEDLQFRITGSAGRRNLAQANRAYLLFKALHRRISGSLESSTVADFGAGWGRIARFFLRDVPGDRLWLLEPDEGLADFARGSLPCSVTTTPRWPPTDLPAANFDLIYSFSVFSHLGEDLHLAWIDELHRLLKPGGLLMVTTRPRATILHAEKRSGHGGVDRDRQGFAERRSDLLALYDAGGFCHSPNRALGDPARSEWGETSIPASYIRRRWHDFELVAEVDAESAALGEQDVFVVRAV